MTVRKQETCCKAGKQPFRRKRKICRNSVQLISEAPLSEPVMLRFNDTSVKVYKNSTFKPSFYALDKYYNLVPSEAGKVKFGVDVKTSKISADGTYYSGSQAAKGYIYAACGDTQSRMSVEIVDKIGSLSVANDFVLLDVGEKVQLQIEAFDENGEKIIITFCKMDS